MSDSRPLDKSLQGQRLSLPSDFPHGEHRGLLVSSRRDSALSTSPLSTFVSPFEHPRARLDTSCWQQPSAQDLDSAFQPEPTRQAQHSTHQRSLISTHSCSRCNGECCELSLNSICSLDTVQDPWGHCTAMSRCPIGRERRSIAEDLFVQLKSIRSGHRLVSFTPFQRFHVRCIT